MSPETLERENDAHHAALEAFQALLGCGFGDDELIEAEQQRRKIGLVAASHMLADAWRVLCSMPRLQAAQIEALAKLFGAAS